MGSTQHLESFSIDKIRQPLSDSTWFFFSPFPLLDGCFPDAKHGCKNGLADVIFRPDSSDIFSFEHPFFR